MSSEGEKCVNNVKGLSGAEEEKSNWVIGLVGGRCKHVVFPAKIPEGPRRKEGAGWFRVGQITLLLVFLPLLILKKLMWLN